MPKLDRVTSIKSVKVGDFLRRDCEGERWSPEISQVIRTKNGLAQWLLWSANEGMSVKPGPYYCIKEDINAGQCRRISKEEVFKILLFGLPKI